MKTFIEILNEQPDFVKVGEIVMYHNDLKKATNGKIKSIKGDVVKIVNLDTKSVDTRKIKDIYEL